METSTTLFTKFPQAGVLSLTECCLTLSLLVPWSQLFKFYRWIALSNPGKCYGNQMRYPVDRDLSCG